MEENKKSVAPEKEKFPIWQILYRNLILIIAITVLCGAVGIVLGFVTAKDSYTASSNIVLKASYDYEDEAETNKVNDNTLAKRTLPTVVSAIKSPKIVEKAQKNYKDTGIKLSNISTKHKDDSLIFTLSYTDENAEDAKGRLNKIINTIQTEFSDAKFASDTFPGVSEVEFVELDAVSSRDPETGDEKMQYKVSVTNRRSTYIIIGFLGGLVLGICTAFLVFVLDNKVKSISDLEEITGASMLALIQK